MRVLKSVAESHGEVGSRTETTVQVTRADDFIQSRGLNIDHIKIDVEGAELDVLKGLGEFVGKIDSFMIEVTKNLEEVHALMNDAGYLPYDPNLKPLSGLSKSSGNTFFVLGSGKVNLAVFENSNS